MPESRSLEERFTSCALQMHMGGMFGVLCWDCACAYEQEVKTYMDSVRRETFVLVAERDALLAEVGQLRVQLAGCLVAAEGDKSEAVHQGVYGWSPAFEAVRRLRMEYDSLLAGGENKKSPDVKPWTK